MTVACLQAKQAQGAAPSLDKESRGQDPGSTKGSKVITLALQKEEREA